MPSVTRRLLAAALVLAATGARAEPTPADECAQASPAPLLAQGCAVLDAFMTAFNARDPAAWAATLNFPHVRLAGHEVQVWNTPEDYARANDVGELGRSGWSHSRWDWRRLVQQSSDKLHLLVRFTRYGAGDRPLGSYESLYIVTLKDGHWGVQARSSYAGVAVKGSAF
ncbi:hypothetical protein OPKNFCMD_0970 [Methylobacterium crusticola]|uniref:DUF4440 domain-containing protein n=1 Tax=Methylobacterium crusticola TaxID=1697972 RepID=A0ABQ4QSH6_9HYPH|nr:hypothetical protein [Methylobacterium crusticola]GJD48253.1 hypothetical protein OPKNFCMD_0970 [Methylobacterium crusticola]